MISYIYISLHVLHSYRILQLVDHRNYITKSLRYRLPGDTRVRTSLWKVSLPDPPVLNAKLKPPPYDGEEQAILETQDHSEEPLRAQGFHQDSHSNSTPDTSSASVSSSSSLSTRISSKATIRNEGPSQPFPIRNGVSASHSEIDKHVCAKPLVPIAPKSTSERETRLRQRDAILQTPSHEPPSTSISTSTSTSTSTNHSNLSLTIPHTKGTNMNKPPPVHKKTPQKTKKSKKTKKTKKNPIWLRRGPKEECDIISMKTGILYLYRGRNRRAVFVRKK